MKEFRKSKGVTARYTSLEELRKGFGLKPIEKRRTKDIEKLEMQREKFLGKCPVCKQTLSYIYGTNYKVCKNEKCKGIEYHGKNEDGTEYSYCVPYISKPLDEYGKNIAMNLFDE